ncbi:hypothetical protein BJB45_17120 [Halomonas huangheensis]|uniref:FAD/NAD(P)-binding domain-containing protein n=2 Tax=Halomonas huangheensis TaxID=1178482 RepID=W1ND56_9GAMM|nr:hypothetical protein AR456_09585 [Halomonas huangheensis]ERL53000.1 hypothetical protein BJB45_17120 [Halomonas huangheensis]
MLAGDINARDMRIDPARTCRQRGIKLIRQRAMKVTPERQCLMLGNGTEVYYDVLSMNLGSMVQVPDHRLPNTEMWGVKPISRLRSLHNRLRRQFSERRQINIVVQGGGASGIEMACALRQLGRHHGVDDQRLAITLLHSAEGLLPNTPSTCRNWLAKCLLEREIQLKANPNPHGYPHGAPTALLEDVDHLLFATGLQTPSDTLGLPSARKHGLLVDHQLRVEGQNNIFAAGDCIDFAGQELARIGVHGVRQGPVLLHNLQAVLNDQPLQPYQPPEQALSILNLGANQALALYGRHWWGGRLASHWKSWLDQRFLEHHRVDR